MSIEIQVIDRLRKANLLLCTIESCTGGLIAHRITNIPGASDVFWGSIVAYDNLAKERIVGVPSEILRAYGAVSHETARALARLGAEKASQPPSRKCIGLSTTGIAGPGGGTPTKPVGLCYLGLSLPDQPVQSREIRVNPALDRTQIKIEFSSLALQFVLENLT